VLSRRNWLPNYNIPCVRKVAPDLSGVGRDDEAAGVTQANGTAAVTATPPTRAATYRNSGR
jgi:hypothetical protein